MRTGTERACEWLEANGHGVVEHCAARSGGDTCDSWELRLVSGARGDRDDEFISGFCWHNLRAIPRERGSL
jgi:hypothetical protein